jgi:hypothetical protein
MSFEKLSRFLNHPFHLLDKKQNRWILIVVTGVFVILFMNLYLPFNVSRWYVNERIPLVLILSSFGVIGMMVLAISQLLIRNLFRITSLRMYGVMLWFLVELILLTLTMYLIYGDRHLKGSNMIAEMVLTLKYTTLILIIPYSGVLLFLYATQNQTAERTYQTTGNHLVKIMDENGILQIAIDQEYFLFIKSADNYVEVFFLKDSKVRKELVRTTMKKLEAELKDFPIRRCHRSFMVNIEKISLSEKSTQGLTLSLNGYPDESIPVSKNFKPWFIQLLREKIQLPPGHSSLIAHFYPNKR